MGSQQWTQEQAINYECAREAINHLIALYTSDIGDETSKPTPNQRRIAFLRTERTALTAELRKLHVTDTDAVTAARAKYSAAVNEWRKEHPRAAAA